MAQLVDITAPEDSQEGTESAVAAWLKKPGDEVREDEPLLEISTDKVDIEVAAPASGTLEEIVKKEGDAVGPGDVLGRIRTGAAGEGKERREAPDAVAAGAGASATGRLTAERRLSPAVRKLVKEHGLDVSEIQGSGRGGRVTYQDAREHLQTREVAPADTEEPAAAAPPGQEAGPRFIPHSTMRKKIARHMVESMLETAPHVTAVFEADLGNVIAHRESRREDFRRRGANLTYTAYFVAAAVQALRSVPEINSRWHDDGLEVFGDCNIGVAAAVEKGLVVPVIRRAQSLSLFGIAQKLQDLTERARAGKLGKEDLEDGTFTITNHGVSGSLIATPIIHQPQSAILGVGKLEKRVVVQEGGQGDSLLIRPRAYVTLTIDHRALDGYQANAFLSAFCEALRGW